MKLKTLFITLMSLIVFIAATFIVVNQTKAKNKPFLYNNKIINITNLSNIDYNIHQNVSYNNIDILSGINQNIDTPNIISNINDKNVSNNTQPIG